MMWKYIGKAKNGIYRPTITYPQVVRDLHQNRGRWKCLSKPGKPYFKRNPWGFRWIHHELEASVERILNGNPHSERIELHFIATGLTLDSLHKAEKDAIATARAELPHGVELANGMPSMRVQYARARECLDAAWI